MRRSQSPTSARCVTPTVAIRLGALLLALGVLAACDSADDAALRTTNDRGDSVDAGRPNSECAEPHCRDSSDGSDASDSSSASDSSGASDSSDASDGRTRDDPVPRGTMATTGATDSTPHATSNSMMSPTGDINPEPDTRDDGTDGEPPATQRAPAPVGGQWQSPCYDDTDCRGELVCMCGQCSMPCAVDDCEALAGASCVELNCAVEASCVSECEADPDCPLDMRCEDSI